MSYETYIKSNITTEAIKAGLVQDRDGRWVKPPYHPTPPLPTALSSPLPPLPPFPSLLPLEQLPAPNQNPPISPYKN